MTTALLASIEPVYFRKLLDWKNIPYSNVGMLLKVENQSRYNNLIDINTMFSTSPMGDPIDRTQNINGPFKFKVFRPWSRPIISMAFDEVMAARVRNIIDNNKYVHMSWSGGMDSTAMVAAFLQHAPNIDQLELVYTPFSLYENQAFFDFVVKKYPKLKTLEISNRVYLSHRFPGVIVSGHGGDEFTASLDQSFFDNKDVDLSSTWQHHWHKHGASDVLMDFSEWFFSLPQRPITTLLEARWWFYACCKSQFFAPKDCEFAIDNDKVDLNKLIAFYDCPEFEDYMWQDPMRSIDDLSDYTTYKKFLRRYTFNFYPDQDYLNNYTKINSIQFLFYKEKKIELLDLRSIATLDDGTVIRTKNLPFLSQKEFNAKYGNSLDYLFNISAV